MRGLSLTLLRRGSSTNARPAAGKGGGHTSTTTTATGREQFCLPFKLTAAGTHRLKSDVHAGRGGERGGLPSGLFITLVSAERSNRRVRREYGEDGKTGNGDLLLYSSR